ncbi:hypothetical protein OIO90_000879 [Microbotryomycetes sp. JL221]|nr:hypothetical protein OIO90_000879 [Microbotryomycetes sp. JL221]
MLGSMSRAASSSAAVHQAGGLVFKGVFLHPDHLVGFDSPSLENEDHTALHTTSPGSTMVETTMALSYTGSSSSSSIESMVGLDYFSFRPSSSSPSSASSSPSSTASTPTIDTVAFKTSDNRLPEAAPMPSPAMLSFSTFAAPCSQPPSRASSPKLSSAAVCRQPSSSSMQRAVSSPVETQWALDRRRQAMCVASDMVNEQASRMARSKSVASHALSGGSSMPPRGPSQPIRRQRPTPNARSPLVTPFEAGWGSSLPPRTPEPQHTVPFPYNVALKPTSPARLARSHSVSHIVPISPSIASASTPSFGPHIAHRNSVPGIYTQIGSTSSPSSPVNTRPRRGTLSLSPLTPIVPCSSSMHPIMDFEPTTDEAASLIGLALEGTLLDDEPLAPALPNFKPSLHRGMTY